MTQFIATVIDTTGIQSYIFGSNRLRENIGASYLVGQATEQWARESLTALGEAAKQPVHLYEPTLTDSLAPQIQTSKVIGELLYAGGGNATLLFASLEYAIRFTQILSRRILKEAPGIQLIAAHRAFDWSDETSKTLYKVFETLIDEDLPAKKQTYTPSAPLLGLSVTADCQSTQLVAMDIAHSQSIYDVPAGLTYRISREIAEKLKSVTKANDHLKQTIFKEILSDYKIPKDFDDFSRSKGDISYIAVVHADGNNMGKTL